MYKYKSVSTLNVVGDKSHNIKKKIINKIVVSTSFVKIKNYQVNS